VEYQKNYFGEVVIFCAGPGRREIRAPVGGTFFIKNERPAGFGGPKSRTWQQEL